MIDCLLAYCVVTTTSYVGRLFCFNTPEQQTEKLNSMKLSIKQSILFISIEKILLYISNRQIKLMPERQQVVTTIWAELIEELIPENSIHVTIEKDLEKGFDYRRITITGLEGWENK